MTTPVTTADVIDLLAALHAKVAKPRHLSVVADGEVCDE